MFCGVRAYRGVLTVMAAILVTLNVDIPPAGTAPVSLTGSDPFGSTSFNTGLNWSDSNPPSSGNDYFTSTFGLRTPTSGSHTFAGDSLSIDVSGSLGFKTPGPITVNNLLFNGGVISQSSVGGSQVATLAGNVTVSAASRFDLGTGGSTRTILLSANLSGAANLTVDGGAGTVNGPLRLTGNNATYSGDWTLRDRAVLRVQGGSTTGAGNVSEATATNFIRVDDGTMNVSGNFSVNDVHVGTAGGSGTLNVDGTVTIGSGTQTLNVGVTTGSATTGILDLSDSASVTIDVATFTVHDSTSAGLVSGTQVNFGSGTNTVEANTLTLGGRKGDAAMDIQPGGTFDLQGQGGARANFFIGRNNINSGSRAFGDVDLSNAATVDLFVNNLLIGEKTSGGVGRGVGRLTLGTTNTVDATLIEIGQSDNGGQTAASDQSRITLGTTNNFKVNTFNISQEKSNALVSFAAPGSTLDLVGSTVARSNLRVGRNIGNTGSDGVGEMDLSDGTFTAMLDTLVIGHSDTTGVNGSATGTLTLGTSAGNSVDVNNVQIANLVSGASATGTLEMNGGTFTVNNGVVDGGGTTTVQVDGGAMTVASGFSVDTLRVGHHTTSDNAAETGSLTVSGGVVRVGTGTENFDIGRRDSNSAGPNDDISGTVDFSGAGSVTIDVAEIRLGTMPAGITGQSQADGSLTLSTAGTNDVTADTILVGNSDLIGNNVSSSLTLGGAANNVNVDTFRVGGFKSDGNVSIAAGGTLTLAGNVNPETDLLIGDNNVNTGSVAVGDMDLTGGTFNATLDELRIGRHQQGGGSGAGQGTLTFGAGTVSANTTVLAEPNLAGVSNNPTNTTGDIVMNGGSFTTDDMTVALNGGTGLFDGNAGTVSIGTGASDNLFVARRTKDIGTGTAQAFTGTMDLTGVTTFTADVGTLGVGTVVGGGGGQLYPNGELILASSNMITASEIVIGDSQSVGLGGANNRIELGASNTIHADKLVIGGDKGVGTMEFGAAASSLTLRGSAGGVSRADVFVGQQEVGTGGGSNGTLDLSLGSLNGRVDQLVIGSKPNAASGATVGTVTIADGTLDVNSIDLGVRTDAGSAGSVTGTLNQNGGTITVNGSVTDGGGTSNVNVNDGTMTVSGNVGSGTNPIDSLTVGDGDATAALLAFAGNVTVDALNGGADGTLRHTAAFTNTLTVGDGGASSTYSGLIEETGGGTLNFVKTDDGTFTMAVADAHNGTTTVNGGTMIVANPTVLPDTDATVSSATLNLPALAQTVSTLTLSDGNVTGPAALTLSSNAPAAITSSGTSLIDDTGATLNLPGPTATIDVIDGSLTNNRITTGGNLVKEGPGLLTMSQANTYSGMTTVNDGTLNVTGRIGPGGDTTVNSGGTLAGSDAAFSPTVIGNVTVNTGGEVSVGDASLAADIATLTIDGDIEFRSGTTLNLQISDLFGTEGVNPGWDKLVVSGMWDVMDAAPGSITIELGSVDPGTELPGLANNFDPTMVSPSLRIIQGLTDDLIESLTNPFIVDASGFQNPQMGRWVTFRIGTDLYLRYIPIPEPATILIAIMGMVGGLGLQLRRRSKRGKHAG